VVRGKVLQHVDRAALIAHDRYEIDRRHLGADELLCRCQCAQLIVGPHGAHVEVEREQTAIAVLRLTGDLGCDRGAGQPLVDLDLLWGGSGRFDIWSGRELLMLEELDGLGHTILGEGEVLPGQVVDGFAVLVLHHDCFNHELRFER
jgi:hypothetical protein